VYRGKNQKDRTVSLSFRLAEAIRNYISKYRSRTTPRHVRRSDPRHPVFYNDRCRPYTPNVLYLLFRKAGEDAGIPKRVHPHMFRHTFAVQALRSGVDIYTLQELLGHSDIITTTQYLRFMNTRQKELGGQLDFPIGQRRFT
ncbi:tyrosine-type recombinase/integrase, partial [Candidatus Pacearchaeota archaeon]|nr:tyrosine-type recombinase/integrase [Candidatus Pacearchaeota archaeon]